MQRRIVLVGAPNVGKSVIFNNLTGKYVNVSNYPGTTVEVARGYARLGGVPCEIVDTPGIYSLAPITDEERVTREFLLAGAPDLVVHVADAKNLARSLPFTLALLDAGLPVILVLNLIDEAAAAGLAFDTARLAGLLGIPVVAAAAVRKIGLDRLRDAIVSYRRQPQPPLLLGPDLEAALAAVTTPLGDRRPAVRILALLLLAGDPVTHSQLKNDTAYPAAVAAAQDAARKSVQPFAQLIAAERQAQADRLAAAVVTRGPAGRRRTADFLDLLTRQPLTGIPILALVLYWGLYKFVGGFGAGFLVDYIDDNVFARVITPAVHHACHTWIPWEWLQSLLAGEYGLFTLGLRYAVAIILPIVGTFFVAFALLEDCGYLPRLAMLVDGLFKRFGLNGRAVIPVTLGLGCGTMAVFVVRTLETKRERLLATFLLALTIPCSAQLGVVLAILAGDGRAVALWAAIILAVFILSGLLAARLLPGERSPFYIELPPLRIPDPANVLHKASTRMIWYFVEIIPVFFLASFLLWLGDRSGLLAYIIKAVEPLMAGLGLPAATAPIFLLGFFRRDYGAAGLYDMAAAGLLGPRQLLVAAVALTLFVPCVAQLMVIVKERGPLAAAIMTAIIAVVALAAGWLASLLAPLVI
ncbi:ferrous iron transport protein B [Anaeroselena agilis]|uniref:Ferrous iron transport protein B n=1 Tax=Anaeroselena agilis TaxID=3063788 RepID=A0ABU3NY29_9FIRM|nr:ferrous iron transport protein B [Selenomonadales bacterium 4137-cl]